MLATIMAEQLQWHVDKFCRLCASGNVTDKSFREALCSKPLQWQPTKQMPPARTERRGL